MQKAHRYGEAPQGLVHYHGIGGPHDRWPKVVRYTVAAMRRSTVLLVMLFAMLWQSVALARIGSTVNSLVDREHTALHWQEEGHHHHEDGSYHLSSSNDAVQHVLGDHVSATLAVMVAASHDFLPLAGSAAPGGLHEARVPNPTLDGLLRPPRFRS